MIGPLSGILAFVALCAMELLGVGRDDHTMAMFFQGQEEGICKGEGFLQARLGQGQVDEQVLGWLEVPAVVRRDAGFEEWLSSGHQQISIL